MISQPVHGPGNNLQGPPNLRGYIPLNQHLTVANPLFTDFSFTKVVIFASFEAVAVISDQPFHYEQALFFLLAFLLGA